MGVISLNLSRRCGGRVDVHFQGPEEGVLLHASQELGLRLLPLAATGKVLVEKGVHVFLACRPIFDDTADIL